MLFFKSFLLHIFVLIFRLVGEHSAVTVLASLWPHHFVLRRQTSTLFSFLWKIRKFSQSGSLVPSSQSGQLPTSSFPHSHHFLSTSNTFYNLKYKQIHFWFRKIHHLNLDTCQQVHFHTRLLIEIFNNFQYFSRFYFEILIREFGWSVSAIFHQSFSQGKHFSLGVLWKLSKIWWLSSLKDLISCLSPSFYQNVSLLD